MSRPSNRASDPSRDAFAEAERRIASWQKGTPLDLVIEGLKQIPDSIDQLSELTELRLARRDDFGSPFGATQVIDLSPLQGLTALQSLNCGYTQVIDLSPLQGLTALQSLDCGYTQVIDLSPL
ncbi:MAG: leucine-rich repeat domain-containing protein, partial [Sulfitobacter sp.]